MLMTSFKQGALCTIGGGSMAERPEDYREIKEQVDKMFNGKIRIFLNELKTQISQAGTLNTKKVSATTIDGWLRRAASQSALDVANMNQAAFELWSFLWRSGVVITDQATCQLVPIPNIQQKVAQSIRDEFSTNS
jgi:hypothetical protein